MLFFFFLFFSFLSAKNTAGPYRGNLEDRLSFLTALCLTVSLLLGLIIIMDNPMKPTFDLNLLGIVLIMINVTPFLLMVYAMAKIAHYGPNIGLWEVPDSAAAGVGRTGRKQTRIRRKLLTIDQVRHVVVHEKVRVFELQHAEHHAKALKRIQERKALATSRVALRVKRRNLLRSEKTVVLPVNAAAAAMSSIPVDKTMPQKDIDAVRQSIHDKIGTVQKLQVIFGKLDQNKTLTLSPPEFKRLIGSVMRPPPTKMVFKAIWLDVCQLRKSGDGVKEIDFETFKAWLDF